MEMIERSLLARMDQDERLRALAELAIALSASVSYADDFHHAVANCVASLRTAGHDLWSYDEDEGFEVWGPNYSPPSGPGVIVTFRKGEPCEVAWYTMP